MNHLLIFFVTILSCYSLKIDNTKFCVNCKYFQPDVSNIEFGKCLQFPRYTSEFDNNYLVTSEIINKHNTYSYASTARQFHSMCGKEGKLYEKKFLTKKNF